MDIRNLQPGPERRLLPMALAYMPVAAGAAALSVVYDVGASPGRGAADLPLRGTALAPPLFLPLGLAAGAALARRPGALGVTGNSVCGLVGLAFLVGSTANLPNDLKAARAAGSPTALTLASAALHVGLALGLLGHAVPALRARLRRRA